MLTVIVQVVVVTFPWFVAAYGLTSAYLLRAERAGLLDRQHGLIQALIETGAVPDYTFRSLKNTKQYKIIIKENGTAPTRREVRHTARALKRTLRDLSGNE